MADDWHMTVEKADLVEGIGVARRRATLRRKGSGFEPDVTFASCDTGLSIRSSASSLDVPAVGTWISPICANGAALRRLAPKLEGPEIILRFSDGWLRLNGTMVSAREV